MENELPICIRYQRELLLSSVLFTLILVVLAAEDGANVVSEADVDDNVLAARVVVDEDVTEDGEAVAGVVFLGCAAEDVVEGW